MTDRTGASGGPRKLVDELGNGERHDGLLRAAREATSSEGATDQLTA